MSNAISWFEIPSTNFERAVKFYSELMNYWKVMRPVNEYLTKAMQ